MSELLARVDQNIRDRHLLRPNQSLLVAVSGGLDSIVLLSVLARLATRHRWRLTVAHCNHQLRGRSSNADEQLVCRTAARLALPFVAERIDVRSFQHTEKVSLEMAARQLRHEFFAQAARARRVRTVALAHHADDQVEIFFLRLLRGSSSEGLAGMKWRSPSPTDASLTLIRPLLALPKSALLEYANQQKLAFREDASNAWLDIQRNRLRHELLPLLRRKYQPALEKTVLRTMDVFGAEATFANDAAQTWLAHLEKRPPQSAPVVPAPFDDLPLAVQRSVVRLQLLRHKIPPDFELVEWLRLHPGKRVSAGVANNHPVFLIRDAAGLLHQEPPESGFAPGSVQLPLTGRDGQVTFDGVLIHWKLCPAPGRAQARRPRSNTEFFDADQVGSPIVLRHWQPGDRFQPIGLPKPIKLQDFFTNQKVPKERRRKLAVAVASSGELFWVEGMRISERFKLTTSTKRRLQWAWERLK